MIKRPTTAVLLTKPKAAPPIILSELGVGAYFTLPNSAKVFIKTDETLGKGFRCLDVDSGCLSPIAQDALVAIHYKKVRIEVVE